MKSLDNQNVENVARVFKALGHPARLKILKALMTHGGNVSVVSRSADLVQATTSQHLSILKGCGVIEGKRRGLEVHYNIVSELALKTLTQLTD